MIVAFKHTDSDFSTLGGLVAVSQWLNAEPGYRYKHVEMFFPQWGEAIAARTEDGVKVKTMREVFVRPETWDLYTIPARDEDARAWLLTQLDAGFNFPAVIGAHALGVAVRTTEKVYYCSELTYIVIRDFSDFPIDKRLDPNSITPACLRRLIQDAQRS